MSYFVVCTFDLTNADSEDYAVAYDELESIGLMREVNGNKGKVKLPNTTVAGKFTGDSAGTIRDKIRKDVKNAFKKRDLDSKIFVSVAGNGVWGSTTT